MSKFATKMTAADIVKRLVSVNAGTLKLRIDEVQLTKFVEAVLAGIADPGKATVPEGFNVVEMERWTEHLKECTADNALSIAECESLLKSFPAHAKGKGPVGRWIETAKAAAPDKKAGIWSLISVAVLIIAGLYFGFIGGKSVQKSEDGAAYSAFASKSSAAFNKLAEAYDATDPATRSQLHAQAVQLANDAAAMNPWKKK